MSRNFFEVIHVWLLGLAVICFSGLGVLHKVADFQKCAPPAINAYLFFWAGLFTTTCVFSLNVSFAIPGEGAGVAVACGLCASIAILAFQTGVRFGNMLVINLSTAVPTILSIFFYRENVGLRRGTALVAIVFSLILLWQDKNMEATERGQLEEHIRR